MTVSNLGGAGKFLARTGPSEIRQDMAKLAGR
jgi:hypothetical protein